jgi:hypothetical protein
MPSSPEQILRILDACSHANTFPMLDNGYVYLAASRLSAFHSATDWALTIEVFGYSPRAGTPDVHVYTFASHLVNRDPRERYVSEEAYLRYLKNNPNNESRFFYPIEGSWQDDEIDEFVSADASDVVIRGTSVPIPLRNAFSEYGIALEDPERLQVFELSRYLAATHRDAVLATSAERCTSTPPELSLLLQLEEWRHPDLVNEELPSQVEAFRQLAEVLSTGDAARYRPTESPNTHWTNWPEGGTL